RRPLLRRGTLDTAGLHPGILGASSRGQQRAPHSGSLWMSGGAANSSQADLWGRSGVGGGSAAGRLLGELLGCRAEAVEGLSQVRDLVVGVDALGGLRRGVTEDVLDLGQLGTAIEHHAGFGMPKVMGGG